MVILTLVLNFISTNVVDPLYEQTKNILASSANTQEAVKRLNKETTKEMGVDATLIKGYRFVSTNTLPVFERAARQSKRTNELKFGQVVQILRERKDWVLVEWRSDEGLEGRGWVYTRHLKRFN